MIKKSHSLGQNIFDIKEFDYAIFKAGVLLRVAIWNTMKQ
jgi:hypothetical protein